jgi:Ca2+/Na+ antiporter
LDAVMATLGSIIVWLAINIDSKRKIQRWAGGLLLLVYAAYLTYRLIAVC